MPNLLKEFTRSLRSGTGKAYRILEKHPELPVDDLLIDAALHNYDYDPQCSGSHAFQVAELLKLRPDYKELILQIAERFAAEFNFETWEEVDSRYWDIDQLYDLLGHNRISPRITKMIHERFVRRHRLESVIGQKSIMTTEGIKGLRFIAETLGSSLRNDPDFQFDDWLVFQCRDIYGPDWGRLLMLRGKAGKNADIQTFLIALEDCIQKEIKRAKRPYQPTDMKRIMTFLQEKKKRYLGHVVLAGPERAKLRRMLMEETDHIRLDIICQALARSKSVTYAIIPRLLELSYSSDKPLAYKAIMALGSVKSKGIREIAIKEITENPGGWKFFELLEKNWQPGDEKLFLKWFNRLRSPFTRHSMIMSILAIEDIPLPASLLKYLLNRVSCGNCRGSLARRLAAQNALSDEICQEFLHDAMEKIREIGKQYSVSEAECVSMPAGCNVRMRQGYCVYYEVVGWIKAVEVIASAISMQLCNRRSNTIMVARYSAMVHHFFILDFFMRSDKFRISRQ